MFRCADVYKCDVYDPEGALGWISAAWQTWLGLQASSSWAAASRIVHILTAAHPF
jgi:hypothetical protein